jgi:HEAT repeat protein
MLTLIEGALKHSSPAVRASCVYGLARIGAQTVRTLLLVLYNDQDYGVREEAANAVEGLGVGSIVATLRQRSRSQQESVVLSLKEILTSRHQLSYQHSVLKVRSLEPCCRLPTCFSWRILRNTDTLHFFASTNCDIN